MEMHQLQANARWDVLVPKPHTFHDSHVLIYPFNTRSLFLHKNNVFFWITISKQLTYCASMKHISTH